MCTNHPGEYVLDGTMKFGKEEVAVSANLHVKPIIVAVQNYTRATVKGLVPTLPATLAGILPDDDILRCIIRLQG